MEVSRSRLAALAALVAAPMAAGEPAQAAAIGPGDTEPAALESADAALIAIPTRALAARTEPGGRRLVRIGRRTVFGSRTRLAVLARSGRWLAVKEPVGSANRRVWIKDSGVRLQATLYRIAVSLSQRRLELLHGDRVVLRATAGIGRATNPTPPGRYSLTDKLAGRRFGSVYGCCVLAISGVQTRLPPGFRAGARLALHGTSDPASIGRAASSGCVRLRDSVLRRLIREVPLGTEVRIVR
jgi:lipoprotein-anchoring transpeptidase ErfK/SrfK